MKRSLVILAGLALLALGGMVLFAADTTVSTFDVANQVSKSLRLKDNTDSTFSFQTWVTGDGTHYLPAGDAPARAVATIPSIPGAFVVGEAHVAATQNVATLAAAAAKTTYLNGFTVTGLGATGASAQTVAVSDGTWTLNYVVAIPAGATTGIAPLNIAFNPPLPASAVNTAITVTVPSFGTGNTSAEVSAWGYQR